MMENLNDQEDNRKGIIYLEDVYKSFGSNHVLNGIGLSVAKGENVVVLGKSGTGKSVLIKIICGLLQPDSGTVRVFGKEVNKLNERELRDLRLQIGFSFQSSALYDSMTVGENLTFPLVRNLKNISRQKVQESVRSVLDAVGLLQTIDQMPSELSGGQRKRIGIARTLIMRPKIMLYDEPTAGLDPVTSMEINNLINKVQKTYETTSIIITHDLTCAKSTGNRMIMMYEGKIINEGSFEEVFKSSDDRVKSFYDYNFIQ